MNLISNCCLIGDYCELKNIQYFTPFVWNTFFPDDIKILIKEYKNIDFFNIKLIKYKDTKFYGLNIDNKINCYYIHYLYADHEGLKRNIYLKEVTGRDIEKYIIESYKRRLSRLNLAETPKFLFITNRDAHTKILQREETELEWNEIINLLNEYNYKGIIFTKFKNLIKTENVNIVNIENDNPRQTLDANIAIIDNFIAI